MSIMTNKNYNMNNVLKFISPLAFVFFLFACGSGAKDEKGTLTDKKTKLKN